MKMSFPVVELGSMSMTEGIGIGPFETADENLSMSLALELNEVGGSMDGVEYMFINGMKYETLS